MLVVVMLPLASTTRARVGVPGRTRAKHWKSATGNSSKSQPHCNCWRALDRSRGGNTGGHITKIPSTITRYTYKLHIHARENAPAQAAQLPAKSNIEECLLENRMLKAGDFGSSVRCVAGRKSIARTCQPHQTHSCTRALTPHVRG